MLFLAHNQITASLPRCLLFTSEGGGGHRSADQAICDYIDGLFDVELTFLVRDLMSPLDPVRFVTFNHYCGEDLYNFCLSKRWYRITNLIGNFGSWSVWWYRERIEQMLEAFLREKNPDVIISVIPFYNGPLLTVAQKLNIPCLIVPTDLDSRLFAYDIKDISYDGWRYIVPFDDADITQSIQDIIPSNRIFFGGFPIRKEFFELKDVELLKNDLQIPHDKPVVMLLMGAQGSNACYDCLKSISELKYPLHVIICLGKNTTVAHKIQKLALPSTLSITTVGFTDRISDYMAVSDVLVTKSGTVSVCEALYLGLPVILDQTSTVPMWEQFNHSFVLQHDYGDVMQNYKHLHKILERYLKEPNYFEVKKRALAHFSRPNLGDILVHQLQILISNR